MLDYFISFYNYAFLFFGVFVVFMCVAGNTVVKYLGYYEIEFRDDLRYETHEILVSVFSRFQQMREFNKSLETNFWVRRSTNQHPDVNMILENRYAFHQHSLLENTLAYLAFKDHEASGMYEDVLNADVERYQGVGGAMILKSDLESIDKTFNQYFNAMYCALRDLPGHHDIFIGAHMDIIHGKYLDEIQEDDESVLEAA